MAGKKTLIQTPNRDVIVSWIYTWSRQPNMSIHEQRVVLRILEFCQAELKGVKIKDNLGQIEHGLWNVRLTMPVSSAFFSDYKPAEVKEVLRTLSHRTFEYNDYEDDEWWLCGFISDPKVKFRVGMMEFSVSNDLWNVLLNFYAGYREFELNKALALPTAYSLRFYLLVSGQRTSFNFSVEDLKEWLGIAPDLYKDKDGRDRIDHIEERILRPAKKALDETCPWTFTYEKTRENPRNRTSRVTSFKIIPVYQPKFRDEKLEGGKLQAKVSASNLLDRQVYDYLRYNAGLTSTEIRPHKKLLKLAQEKVPDLLDRLPKVVADSRSAKRPIGYIVNAIKNMVAEAR